MKHSLFFFLIITALIGCIPNDPDYHFDYEIVVADTPVNLDKLNTIYDDYNSDLPYPAARSEIYFSSNRNSSGKDFDIVCKAIDMSYHESDEILNFSIPENDSYSVYQAKLLPYINSDYDELGPLTFSDDNGWDYFFYAGNDSGNLDIKFVYTPRLDWGTYQGQQRLYGPKKVTLVNSAADDGYPALLQDKSRMLFCSNRENQQFDIYSINLNTGMPLHEFLAGKSSEQITRESVLCSPSNDKCPSIHGNFLVFASDRPGGYGGYDLYYSRLVNNQWSTPVNFGEKINSPGDEYRPITFSFNNIDGMIFSSNRSGGKGGYDLYAVRIGDLLKN
ncbi:MAG TPA: hypothetical protein PLW67_05570 [Prolixibacteraceae bacterium]|nr:hypothetical protein [Prolixibacteraceae bacterium]